MKVLLRFYRLFVFLVACIFCAGVHAQVVTSGMTGIVRDSTGKAAAGVTVTAVHTATGTSYTASTTESGRYNFRGMVVGGPYTVSATGARYKESARNDIFTELGANIDINFTLQPEITTLAAFTVTGDRAELDSATTGAATMIDSVRIGAQPTISRSFADMARTNPFVAIRATSASGSQITALGMNSKFNSVTVDGARINDQFGLSTSGLVSQNNPFSLEALEQFTVSLSPYDTRQSGFTGAAINAVTKRGTNDFSGSAYYIFTQSGLQDKDVAGTTAGTRPVLREKTYGFNFGGPILRNRLFFFLNHEKFARDTSASQAAFTPDAAFVTAVTARLKVLAPDVDFGTFGGSATTRQQETRRVAKIDWTINTAHRLTVRYSDTVGNRPDFGAFSATSFSQPAALAGQPSSFPSGTTALSSSFYTLETTEKVWAGQIFSSWSPSLKTQLIYAKTKAIASSPAPVTFPEIRVFNVPAISSTGVPISSGNAFRFGTEISRQGNEGKVDTESYSATGDYFWRDFTLSGGFDRETSDFYNLFRQGSYGVFNYDNLAAFQNDAPSAFLRSVVQTGFPVADFSKFEQTGVFAQVKWDVTSRLSLMFGLRADFIGSPLPPPENVTFKAAFGFTNAGTVDDTKTVAPRFSFNYAVDDERNMQVRGGWGVFLGRIPWVFISNSYGAPGVGRSTDVRGAATAPKLVDYLATQFDPQNPIGATATAAPSSTINLIEDGMNLPTMSRANLATDIRLPGLGATLTAEIVHTEMLDALYIENLNLQPGSTRGADGRTRFMGSTTAAPRIAGFGNVLRVRNVNEGRSTYGSLSLERGIRGGWGYSLGYTRGKSREVQAFGSSTANSNYQFHAVFNQGTVAVSRSDYEIRDRVLGSFSKEFKFWRKARTVVSLFYEGRSGSPYSWVYSTDLNGDGLSGNDLFAVPSGPTDSRFDFSGLSPVQQTAYFNFLAANGLNRFAGGHTPRNAYLQPWQNRLDLRFVQEIPTGINRVKFEVFADFINFGSWLSRDLFNYIETVNTSITNTGLVRNLGAAAFTTAGLIRPTVTLDAAGNVTVPSGSLITVNNVESRWRIQLGARLKF